VHQRRLRRASFIREAQAFQEQNQQGDRARRPRQATPSVAEKAVAQYGGSSKREVESDELESQNWKAKDAYPGAAVPLLFNPRSPRREAAANPSSAD
jgi:hypothetical protein